ncbi:nuclear transport factor 2 family protein [Paucibacter soli]|uniref:nuclear transport factor 2 family protein n=1 Tax=Paucibacter soli TaxID=3133433 RepID=UPI0030B4C758
MKLINIATRIAPLCLALALAAPSLPAWAQLPVLANPDHAAMLASADARLAANKKLVYDFWREVLEAGHLELALNYLAEGYAQHNPNVPTGREGFVKFFGKFAEAKPIQGSVAAPLVAIMAEGELVMLSFVSERPDPKDKTLKYTTTWFDMFRVHDGRITEHWDSAPKQ